MTKDSFFKHIEGTVTPTDGIYRLMLQEAEAYAFGFYWDSERQITDQIKSECDEILCAKDPSHLREEVGDLLNAALSLCLYYELDPHTILRESTEKFQQRFESIKKLAVKEGLSDFKDLSITEKLAFWETVKQTKK